MIILIIRAKDTSGHSPVMTPALQDVGRLNTWTLTDYIAMREPVVSPRTILNYKRLQDKDLKVLCDIKIADLNKSVQNLH